MIILKGQARFFNDGLILDSTINYNLFKLINENLNKMYGDNPDPEIEKRVRDEWVWIQQTETYFTILLLCDLTENLDDFDIPYSIRCSGNASFILYLLGITNINPLPPHYYCPNCHSVIWDCNAKSGIDLEKEKHCVKDGTIMRADGFNIPWQAHLLHKQNHYFYLSLPSNMYEEILDGLHEMGINSVNTHLNSATNKHRVIETNNIILHFNLPELCFDPPTINPSDTETLVELARQYAFKTTPDLNIHIKTFADVISYIGILRSDYTNDEKLKALINTFHYKPSELITCREDLYQYYVDHGCTERMAFKLMSNVRKGKNYLNNFPSQEIRTAKDKWVISFCEDVRYLPSKTDIIEDLFFNIACRTNTSPFESLITN